MWFIEILSAVWLVILKILLRVHEEYSRELNWYFTFHKYFTYRGTDKSLDRPTSRCILFDGDNISLDASLVIYKCMCVCVYIYIYTRVGTSIVATIYLQLIQNRYMFRSFTVLHCSHQHCVQPVASDVEVVGHL